MSIEVPRIISVPEALIEGLRRRDIRNIKGLFGPYKSLSRDENERPPDSGTIEIARNRPELISALSPQTAYIMTSLLQSVVEEGTGKRVRALGRPCAAKTGTTNEVRDAWFIGYTPDVVTGVWVGFDDLKPLGRRETGAIAAAPIWLDYMQHVYTNEPVRSFRIPDGIVYERINPETGVAPETRSEPSIFECFVEGTQPVPFTPAPLETVFSNN